MVHHLKYDGFSKLAFTMAEIISKQVPRPSAKRLVPIPASSRRLAERGYNQAAEIAHALGKLWSIPLDSGLLYRSTHARSQTGLAPAARAKNVAGAFSARLRQSRIARISRNSEAIEEIDVILVDDVYTTGATLSSAAKTLSAAGWKHVGAVTFARAEPFSVQVEMAR